MFRNFIMLMSFAKLYKTTGKLSIKLSYVPIPEWHRVFEILLTQADLHYQGSN